MIAPLQMLAVALSALVVASDLYARRVPNAWLLTALLLGAVWMMSVCLVQGEAGPLWSALLGIFIGLVVLLPMHVFGWMGAGDVKLFATLGFLLGAKALLPIWIIGSVLAGVHGLAMLMSRYWLQHTTPGWDVAQTWMATSPWGRRVALARQGRQGLPYAAYLAMGAMITVFTPALQRW
ncbi:MAG: prepilin peptidase [Rhodanobacter sp.]